MCRLRTFQQDSRDEEKESHIGEVSVQNRIILRTALLFKSLSWACQQLVDAILTTIIHMLCCLPTIVEAVLLESL